MGSPTCVIPHFFKKHTHPHCITYMYMYIQLRNQNKRKKLDPHTYIYIYIYIYMCVIIIINGRPSFIKNKKKNYPYTIIKLCESLYPIPILIYKIYPCIHIYIVSYPMKCIFSCLHICVYPHKIIPPRFINMKFTPMICYT